jgi:anaerobic selenocysteine-containing dehydrogenase
MAAAETGIPAERIEKLAREFAAARPSLAVAGGVGAQHASATEVCAAVNVLNFVAGNVGETVRFGADLPMADGQAGVARLAQAIDGGEVAVLLVHGANPVYTQPKASAFADRFRKVAYKVAIGFTSTRPRRTATWCCPSGTRSSGGTTCGRGPGSTG